MDQLIQQSYRPPDKAQPDEILADLIAAIEFSMQRHPKVLQPLLLAAVRHRIQSIRRIQRQYAHREVRR